MKNSEIRELSHPELLERIEAEAATLQRMRINHTVSPLDNPNKLVFQRRLIARLKTELSQRNLKKETEE